MAKESPPAPYTSGLSLFMTQPYIYTLPEQFILDKSVPMRWKLYALINGFWVSGKKVFASNHFFADKLGCTERHIQNCLEELENLGVLERIGVSQNRTIVPKGTNPAFVGGRTGSSKGDEPSVRHISDSISDSYFGEADASQEIIEVKEDQKEPKKPAKYKNARIVFSWFPNPQKSWNMNSTELEYGLLLFDRGEDKVKQALQYVKNHSHEEFFPQVNKPSDLEKKWLDIATYAKRNR